MLMQAIINIKPEQGNNSMEILDPALRKRFLEISEKLLK